MSSTRPGGVDIQEALITVWTDVLGVAVGPNDDFFELGGDSISAYHVVNGVAESLGIELPLEAIFRHTTIASLSGELARLRGTTARTSTRTRPALVATSHVEGDPFPLSYAQRNWWYWEKRNPGTPTWNITIGLRFTGTFDLEALERALEETIRRHDAIGVSFSETASGPRQAVLPRAPLRIVADDLTTITKETREDEAAKRVGAALSIPFDLTGGPLLRALLLRLTPNEHLFVLVTHHLVIDLAGKEIVTAEIESLYRAFAARPPKELPAHEPKLRYADFVAWQESVLTNDRERLETWKRRLSGSAPSELPTDRPRPGAAKDSAAFLPFMISPTQTRALAEIAAAGESGGGGTLFMGLLAVLATFVHGRSGQEDFVIAATYDSRSGTEQLEELAGTFTDHLFLRLRVDAGMTFRDLVARVREVAIEAYVHRDLPGLCVAESDSTFNTPFTRVIINGHPPSKPAQRARDDGDVVVTRYQPPLIPLRRTELVWVVRPRTDENDVWSVLAGAASLFDKQSVEGMVADLRRIIEGVTSDPSTTVGRLVGHPVRPRTIRASSGEPATNVADPVLANLLGGSPHAVAVEDASGAWTREDLRKAAGNARAWLRRNGVGPGDRVAVLAPTGDKAVVALLLGARAAGALVCPIDPRDAASELERIAPRLVLGASPPGTKLEAIDASLLLNEPGGSLEALAGSNPRAWGVATSGSSGRRKTVVLTESGVGHVTAAVQEIAGYAEDDRIHGGLPLHHTYGLSQLWLAMASGACLYLPAGLSTEKNLETWMGGATILPTIPSKLRLLFQMGYRASARLVTLSGQDADPETRKLFASSAGNARFVGFYGLTESTTRVLWARHDEYLGDARATGRPIRGVHAWIDAEGELWVDGPNVAAEYLDDPEETAKRFPDGKLRTGDSFESAGGDLLRYVGRMDGVFKRFGEKIVPELVEGALAAHPLVERCLVTGERGADGESHPIAWVVARGTADAPTLMRHLRSTVPPVMVPTKIRFVSELATTSNGKLIRKAPPV
jgi:acyl-CoA synthetase (AMP-forming)/AMP-acid ligase II/acyl carrier protein